MTSSSSRETYKCFKYTVSKTWSTELIHCTNYAFNICGLLSPIPELTSPVTSLMLTALREWRLHPIVVSWVGKCLNWVELPWMNLGESVSRRETTQRRKCHVLLVTCHVMSCDISALYHSECHQWSPTRGAHLLSDWVYRSMSQNGLTAVLLHWQKADNINSQSWELTWSVISLLVLEFLKFWCVFLFRIFAFLYFCSTV